MECAIAVPCFMRFFLIYGTQEGSCCSGNMNAQKEPFGLGKELLLIKMLLYRCCFIVTLSLALCSFKLPLMPGVKHIS